MYLLIILRYSTMDGCQRLFLFHLSLSEFCLTVLEMIKRFIFIIVNSEANVITEYINVIQFSSASMVYYFTMIYMTSDRFFALYLNMKYPLYWSEKKTKRLLVVTWIVFILMAICLSFLYKYQLIDYNKVFYLYIWPITESIFLLIAFGTYGYIIRMIYNNNRSNSIKTIILQSNISIDATTVKPKARSIYSNSAFYLPTLLILTFVFLQVVPDVIIFFVMISGRTVSAGVSAGVFITYMFSILTDAIIYILLSPFVKRIFIRKIICGLYTSETAV